MLKKILILILCGIFLLIGIEIALAKTCAEAYVECLEDNGYGENISYSILAIAVCYPGYLWCITFIE